MLIYGCGGHAKVVIDCLERSGKSIQGLLDDLSDRSLFDYSNLGGYQTNIFPDEELIIAVGDNKARKNLSEKISHRLGTVIHPSAEVSPRALVGNGTVIFHKAIVQSGCKVGDNAIINTAASVDHDCVVGHFAHISPHATLAGNVTVGEGTHVGAGAVVIPNITIGKWVTIGAGAVVFRNVPDYAVVVGNPGKVIKFNQQL